ncbi:MAG: pilus assembly protein TadG-related protein [bacterium]|nr:pilus assembly protein TadG-related protein [bacterium]
MRSRHISADRGSVTVFAIAAIVLALVLMAGATAVGQVLVARNRVIAAAEAGALAAAPVTFRPFGATGSAIDEAARLVRSNGATLVRCDCAPDRRYGPRTVVVTARTDVDVLGLREVSVEATAAAEFRPVALLVGP